MKPNLFLRVAWIFVFLILLRSIDEVFWECHTYIVVLVIIVVIVPDSHGWETGTPTQNDGKVLTFYTYRVGQKGSQPSQAIKMATALFNSLSELMKKLSIIFRTYLFNVCIYQYIYCYSCKMLFLVTCKDI